MSKIIVTGGAGFIGSHIVEALVASGHEVHVVDDLSAGQKDRVPASAILHVADIRDRAAIEPLFSGVDYVFHLAAIPQVQYSIEHPEETEKVNVDGTLNVLEASRKAGVKRVIYSASSAAYGDQTVMPLVETMPAKPKSPYGAQKYIGEVLCQAWTATYGLPTVSLRYFNVFGPRQSDKGAYASVIAHFLKQKREGKPLLVIGDGEQTRDFVNVRDVAQANLLAMTSGTVGRGEVINIGTGKKYSVNYIASLFGGPVEHAPPRIEPRDSLADISKAKELLGWEPKEEFEPSIKELLASLSK